MGTDLWLSPGDGKRRCLRWSLEKWELNWQLKINLDQRMGKLSKLCIVLSQKIKPNKVLLIGLRGMAGRAACDLPGPQADIRFSLRRAHCCLWAWARPSNTARCPGWGFKINLFFLILGQVLRTGIQASFLSAIWRSYSIQQTKRKTVRSVWVSD